LAPFPAEHQLPGIYNLFDGLEDDLFGTFTVDQFDMCLLCFVDEASSDVVTNRKACGYLKTLLSEYTRTN
jgi:hypothetical protein